MNLKPRLNPGQGKVVISRRLNSSLDLQILLVEDDESSQRLALHILLQAGMKVDVAKNSEEALLALLQNRYDLILMDVILPGRSGLELTGLIRAKKSGGHIWIVALTACAMKGDRDQCLEAGMDAYVSKPFEGRVLIRLLHTLCSLNRIGTIYRQKFN